MTNKAYIVANEEQEREVLGKLERWGAEWGRSKGKPNDFIPSHVNHITKLPYALLVENNQISWCDIEALYEFDEIVFDGRKEERMSEKYVVSQEFMKELEKWKDTVIRHSDSRVFINDIKSLPGVVQDWIYFEYNEDDEYVVKTSATEINSRLVAVIRWIEDDKVFEAEKPKKWVVRNKQIGGDGDYNYFRIFKGMVLPTSCVCATKFDTKEEAESWANAHQEVVKVD